MYEEVDIPYGGQGTGERVVECDSNERRRKERPESWIASYRRRGSSL